MRLALAASLLLALAPAASAAGSDPLLSGYGGPGDGEQALLGETLIRDSGASAPAGSSPAAPAPGPDELYAPATATEPAPTPVQERPTPAPAPSEPATGGKQPRPQRRPDQGTAATTTTTEATAPVVSAVGSGGSADAPSPVSGRDLALVLAALVALIVLAACARRLAVGAARTRRPMTFQAP
jgi:hypothetical protein